MAESKKSLFTPEKTWRRLYYVYGFTDDEFYTDGGSRLDIVSFIHQELKRIGYERVILYDWHTQLFCLDEASYALVDATHRPQTIAQPVRIQNRGLRRGKWGARSGAAPQPAAAPASTAPGVGQSGVEMSKLGDGQLHLGVQDIGTIARQIDSYMRTEEIKSAIVINLGSNFRAKFEQEVGDDFAAGYGQLGADNKNIIVLIFADNGMGNLFENDHENSWLNESIKNKRVNDLHIVGPNVSELRNMLSYFRLRHGLQYDLGQLDELAAALHHAMTHCEGTMRIKELYLRLELFCKKGEPLTCDGCYSLLGITKPLSGQQQLEQLIGMQSVKKALGNYKRREVDRSQVFQYQTASRLQLDPPRPPERGADERINFVITGNPGTGKTTVARIIGQLFYEMGYLTSGHLVKVTRADLVAGYVGQTAIKTREKIQEAIGGVLFVDEAYSLKREDQSDADFGQEAIDTLNEAMTDAGIRGNLIMVFAGYEAEMETFLNANPGLSSRAIKLHIEDYTPEEMRQILLDKVGKLGYRFSEDFTAKLPDFCENWVNRAGENWGNGREAENLAATLHHNWENDRTAEAVTGDSGEEIRVLETRHLPQEMRAYLKPVLVSREECINALNNMVGLAGVKAYISRMRKREAVGKMKAPGHYLFVGNPGTGKTTVARLMGQLLRNMGFLKRGHCIEYTATELMQAVQRPKMSFRRIAEKAKNGVLFIDEAYQLCSYDVGKQILDELLPFMENHKQEVCIILAGYEEDIKKLQDENPGFKDRFAEMIRFDNYSADELYRIMLGMLEAEGTVPDEGFKSKAKSVLNGYLPTVIHDRDFGNARYIREKFIPACEDARNDRLVARYGWDTIPEEEINRLTEADFPDDLSRYTRFSQGKEKQEESKTALEQVQELIGFREVKQKLADLLQLGQTARETGMYDLLNLLSFHWILKGNPGTGKTTVAKLMGQVYQEMGLLPSGHVIVARRQDLVGSYLGQTEQKTQEIIDRAMGGVLFIDEAYTLKPTSGDTNDFGQIAIDVILEQMSARNGQFAVIVAGYPGPMERFLRSNPGLASRFEQEFLLEDYTGEELRQIFEQMCKKRGFGIRDDLEAALEPMFTAMIQAKIKDWGNGREAEKLLRRMTNSWARDIDIETGANGEKVRYFALRHLPEDYRRYLEVSHEEAQPGADSTPQEVAANGFVPRDSLRAPDEAFSFEQTANVQTDSVVYIQVEGRNFKASGTGSLITSDGYILTCSHVVRGAETIRVRLKQRDGESPSITWETATVIWNDAKLDAAIIKIRDGNYPTLALRPADRRAQAGENIYHWGYAFGGSLGDNLDVLEPSLFQGYVSSVQTKKGRERINTDMEAKRGCSGGPVFSKTDGAILGILCGSQSRNDDGLQEEINFVLPIRYIWENAIRAEDPPGAEPSV